jgi:chromosome segregation ATPase
LDQSGPVAEEDEIPASTPKKVNSTKIRVRECENKLARHINLIHAQDFKTTAHEDSVAEHAKKIEGLGSRLKVVEKGSLQGGEKIEAIQQSVAEVTERLNSRGSSIRKEVKTQFNGVQHTITHEQNQTKARLDRFSDSLAVQKARLEDCQKAVNEQGNKIKDQEEGLNNIETSLRKNARKLSARIDELEGLAFICFFQTV